MSEYDLVKRQKEIIMARLLQSLEPLKSVKSQLKRRNITWLNRDFLFQVDNTLKSLDICIQQLSESDKQAKRSIKKKENEKKVILKSDKQAKRNIKKKENEKK